VPNRHRRSNPASSRPRKRLKSESMPLTKAQQHKGYEKARKAYKKFHGSEPTHATVYQLDDGKPGIEYKVVTQLGHAPEVHYIIPDGQKSPSKENTHWVHHTNEGQPPALLYDPQTQTNMLVGGAMKVDDWLYD